MTPGAGGTDGSTDGRIAASFRPLTVRRMKRIVADALAESDRPAEARIGHEFLRMESPKRG